MAKISVEAIQGKELIDSFPFFILSNHLDSTRVASSEWLHLNGFTRMASPERLHPNGHFAQQKGVKNDDGKRNRAADLYHA